MHTYTKLDEDIMMFLSFLSVLWFNLRFSAHTEKLAIVYGKLSGKYVAKDSEWINRIKNVKNKEDVIWTNYSVECQSYPITTSLIRENSFC